MKRWKLGLVLLALAFSPGFSQTQGGLGDEISQAIEDYLGGSDELINQIKEALKKGATPSCTLPGSYNGIAIRRFHEVLTKVGDILCALKVTCFTNYVKDFFPIVSNESEIRGATQGAKEALYMGRWYQVYRPLQLLREHYENQKQQRGLKGADSPKAFLIYPDFKVGEREGLGNLGEYLDNANVLNSTKLQGLGQKVSYLGDADILDPIEEGDLIARLRYPYHTFDTLDTKTAGAGEYLSAIANEALPGFLLFLSDKGPVRLFIIVGKTAPSGVISIDPLDGCPSTNNNSNNNATALYMELIGRVPQFWADIVAGVLPMARAW